MAKSSCCRCCCCRYFSKVALFMLGLFFSHGYVQFAFWNVIIEFIGEIIGKDKLWYNAVVSTSLEGTTALWASFLAYSNYAQKHPIITILISQGLFLSGLLALWLVPSPPIEIIYLVLGLLALGKAGRKTISSFLECQIKLEHDKVNEKKKWHEKDEKKKHDKDKKGVKKKKHEKDKKKKHEKDKKKRHEEAEKKEQEKDEKRVKNCTNVWENMGLIAGIITAALTSSTPWRAKFMIGAIAMGVGYVSFCFGLMHYKPETQTTNTLVLQDTQSRKNWQRWKHLKLFPLWTPFLACYVVQASGSTFFMEQIDILGKKFVFLKFLSPEICMVMLQTITSSLTISVFNLKCCPNKNWKHQVRLSSGTVFSFCCCIASWHVQGGGLHLIKNSERSMNFFWLGPQFFLLGCTTGLVGEGLKNFFLYLVPASGTDLGFAFNKLVEGMGKYISVVFILVFRRWIRDTINTSRLDNYYRTLAFLNFVALFLFTYLSNSFDWKIDLERTDEDRRGNGDDETLMDKANDALAEVPQTNGSELEEREKDKDKNPEKIEEGNANLVP